MAGSADNSLWLWNATNGQFYASFYGHDKGVTCGGFTPDGKSILSCSEDATTRLWNPKTGEFMFSIKGHGFHEDAINCFQFKSDSNVFGTGSVDKTACLANWSTGKVNFCADFKI